MCEAVPQQVNFLIDEAASAGKGANATISYVHYYFANHGLGETDVHFNGENCSGQNKDNYSETPLTRTPRRQAKLSVLTVCPY